MNPTGIEPIEYKVLIQVEEVEQQTTGGIWLADTTREREQMAHDRGTLIDKSEMAFSDFRGTIPEVGDKIIFNKYAGTVINYRKDNKLSKYRLCNDKDVVAVIREG